MAELTDKNKSTIELTSYCGESIITTINGFKENGYKLKGEIVRTEAIYNKSGVKWTALLIK
jgi:hypothetical protein